MKFITDLIDRISKKKTPDQFLTEVKCAELELKKEKARLEIESKKSRNELNAAISQAAKAQREGDAIGIKEHAAEIKSARLFAGQITRERLMNIKSLSLMKMAGRKINLTLRKKADGKNSIQQVIDLLKDDKLQKLLNNYEISVENFEQELEIMMGENEISLTSTPVTEVSGEEEALIEQLVIAQEKGDEKRVAQIMARLHGENLQTLDLGDKV